MTGAIFFLLLPSTVWAGTFPEQPAAWRSVDTAGNAAVLGRALERERASAGYGDMVPLANALLMAGGLADSNPLIATELAAKAAPDSPQVRWRLLQGALSVGAYQRAAGQAWALLIAAAQDPWVQLRAATVLGLAVCVGAWFAVVALVLYHTVACGRLLLHDYSDSFPRRFRRVTPAAFGVVVLAVLWLAGVGPLVVLTIIGVMLTPYMNLRGRVAFGVAACVGCLLPLVWGELAREAGPGGATAWGVYRVWRGDSGADLAAELERATTLPAGRQAYLLARLARRDGDMTRAAKLLAQAPGNGLPPALLATEQGNHAFLNDDLEGAQALYEAAARTADDDPVPWLNQHLVQLRQLELDRADEALARARRLDRAAAERLEAALLADPEHLFPVSHDLPRSWVMAAYYSGTSRTPAWVGEIRSALFLPGPYLRPEFVGLFAVAMVLLAGREGQQRRSSTCPSCGFVICPRCSRRVKGSLMCSACWSVDHDRDLDAAERERLEQRTRRWVSGRQAMGKAAHLLLPGWGDYCGDSPGWGFLVTMLWSLGAGLAVIGALYPLPLMPWGEVHLSWLAGASVLAAAHLAGVWRAARAHSAGE